MKNDYYEDLEAYEAAAEDMYDDFDQEYYEEDFDTGFEGLEDDYYYEDEESYIPAYEDEYDSYDRASIGRIDPNDRTLTIVVKNTAQEDKEAIIFAANQRPTQAQGIEVNVQESSHAEVQEESQSNPFKIAGMKMSVSDALQFDNVIRIVSRTSTGKETRSVYQPRSATSPQNNDKTLIDDDNFEMDVTGRDSMRFMVKAGTTVVFTMTIKARANMSNLLAGQNVAEMSTTPRTTGLPQLDLIRKKRPSAFGLKPRRKIVRRPVRGGRKRFKKRPRLLRRR